MRILEFRVIPGYENYGVTQTGFVRSLVTGKLLSQYMLNGYLIVDTFRGSLTETLPVHRAVALAWVLNDDPVKNTVVNHLDGNKLNNDMDNLEWTTYSGNSYHAVNNDLRSDNFPCHVRDFITGMIIPFKSVSQASAYMGLRRDTLSSNLLRKQFGALINDRYEFKFIDDPTPWFYENRFERINPSRYMVEVVDSDGNIIREVFSNRNMLKEYGLYDSPYGKSIPALAKYANEKYPTLKFRVRDSYSEEKFRVTTNTERPYRTKIRAVNDDSIMEFSSLRKTAEYFNVCRKSITHRLNTDIDLNGWIFVEMAA